MPLLSPDDVQQRCAALPGWSVDGDAICRTFKRATFHHAIGFVVQIAMLAEVADHHPNIDIRYNTVHIVLSTHSAGGVTEKDFALAAQIDALV